MFKGKTLLITGGTGSFGNAVLRRFLATDIGEIRIFSRDEKKQDDMRKLYHNEKIKFYIGDVRDLASVRNAMFGVDYIFSAAALKQVPSCEFFPMEAVKTLLTKEEYVKAEDLGRYYRVPADQRDLNYDKYFVDGSTRLSEAGEYTSSNTERLDVAGVKAKLLELAYVCEELAHWRC